MYPQQCDELDQCEADINDIATDYGSKCYRYHKMFSAKAANAIIEHNIAINWGKVDDRLLHLVMYGTQSRNASFVSITITQLNSARNKGVKKFPFKRPHKTWKIFGQWNRKTKIDMVEISFK